MISLRKFIIPCGYALLVAYFLVNAHLVSIGIAIGLLFMPIFILNSSFFFIFFILVRPIVDLWGGISFAGFNMASLLTILLIFICAKELLFNRKQSLGWPENKFLRTFNFLFVLFICISFVSLSFSADKMTSISDFLRLISILLSFNYAALHFSSTDRLKKLVGLVLLSSLPPLAYGFYQWHFKTAIGVEGMNRLYGTFAHANVYAEYLMLIFFVSVFYLSVFKTGRFKKIFIYLIIFSTLFQLYNTFTRTVWIALAITFCVYIFMKRNLTKQIIYFLVGLGVVALIYSQVQQRFEDISSQSTEGRRSLEWRQELWRSLMHDIMEKPLTGNGLGMFEREIGVMAHNDFFRLAYEAGIPGAILFFGLFFYILVYSFRGSKTALISYQREKYNLCFCLVAALLICSMAVNTLRSTVIIFYYLTVIAAMIPEKPKMRRPA